MTAKKDDKTLETVEVKEEKNKTTPDAKSEEVKEVKAKKVETTPDAKKEEVKEVKAKKEKVEKKAKKEDVKSTKVDNKHGAYYKDVEVSCICGANFSVNTTVAWPIKTETCHKCHPVYNDNKQIKQVIKGRMEKFLEKQKRMETMKK